MALDRAWYFSCDYRNYLDIGIYIMSQVQEIEVVYPAECPDELLDKWLKSMMTRRGYDIQSGRKYPEVILNVEGVIDNMGKIHRLKKAYRRYLSTNDADFVNITANISDQKISFWNPFPIKYISNADYIRSAIGYYRILRNVRRSIGLGGSS